MNAIPEAFDHDRFAEMCHEFAEKVLANEPGKSPVMVDYLAAIVRSTVAFHMWSLLDQVEEELKAAQ